MPSLKRAVKSRSHGSVDFGLGDEVLVDGVDEGLIFLAAAGVGAGFHGGGAGVRGMSGE